MIKRITFSVASVLLGIFVSLALAVFVGVMTGLAAFLHFWKGLIRDLKAYQNKEKPNETKTETVWEKHMRLKGIVADETTES